MASEALVWLHGSTHEILSLYQFGASAGSTLQRMMSKKIFLCIKIAFKTNFFQLKRRHTGREACSIWCHWACIRHSFLLTVACNLSLSEWGDFRAIANFCLFLWMNFFDSFNFYCVEPESGRDENGSSKTLVVLKWYAHTRELAATLLQMILIQLSDIVKIGSSGYRQV